MKFSLVLALAGAGSTLAVPIPLPFFSELLDKAKNIIVNPISDLLNNEQPDNAAALTAVSPSEVPGFARIAQFARTAYCSSQVVSQWACGEACEANPKTQPILTGGDDGKIPRCRCYPNCCHPCSYTQLTLAFCSLRGL
jgi:hypothetical protein